MILIDTSVWADHLNKSNVSLQRLLNAGQVLGHPFVIGELAVGNLKLRTETVGLFGLLPKAVVATDAEALAFIGQQKLFGTGIGYIDVHLLLATVLTSGALFWTRDKRLARVASTLGIEAKEVVPKPD